MSRRVLILSADIGDGHTTAARSLAAALRELGAEVHVDETLRSLGRLQAFVLRDGSRALFRFAPRLFHLYYRLLLLCGPARALAARSLVRFGARPLVRMIAEHRPDVVVSTYPATTVVLGALRRCGRVRMPAVATITDLAGLFFWAHPGIDLHLVNWAESVEEVLAVAPHSVVRTVAPLTSAAFFRTTARGEARRRLELPAAGRVVVVSGGGWGVGDLVGAVEEVSSVPGTITVCLAGRAERVRRDLVTRFGDRADIRVLGFTERMSDLLAAADVLVHATGGMTCLEARLRDCPVVLYGFAIGHVRHNAESMERRGLVWRAQHRADLAPLVDRALLGPTRRDSPGTVPAAELVLAARAQVPVEGRRAWARARLRLATALVAATATTAFATTEPGEAVVHRVEALHHHDARAPHHAHAPPTR
jgi:processive 1,2-diacylglycerol beta-glucosyltransferase